MYNFNIVNIKKEKYLDIDIFRIKFITDIQVENKNLFYAISFENENVANKWLVNFDKIYNKNNQYNFNIIGYNIDIFTCSNPYKEMFIIKLITDVQLLNQENMYLTHIEPTKELAEKWIHTHFDKLNEYNGI